jgi:hypothetical protein
MSGIRLSVCVAAVVLTPFLQATPAAAQVDQKQAVEDWKALDILCVQYQRDFLSESDAKKKGAAFKDEWEAWKKQFQPAWAQFQKRYGKDHIAVGETFKGITKPQGVSMDAWQVANVATSVDVAQAEKGFAEWAMGWAKEALRVATYSKGENLEQIERKVVRAEDTLRYCNIAKMWDPKCDSAEQITQAEAIIKEAKPLWKKALAELKWPGHNTEFAGPGKPDELAAAALEFLRKNPNWTKPEYNDEHTPLAACVTAKGWEVWKKAPLTEQPTQYSVELLVAFTGKADPELAYCYRMVFYTAEEAGGKPGLPLKFANSKQYACFRMLKSKMPAK